MPRRRRTASTVVVVVCALVLGGCGSAPDPQPTTASSAAPSSALPSPSSTKDKAKPTPLETVTFIDALERKFAARSTAPAKVEETGGRVLLSVTLHSPDEVLTLTAPKGAVWDVESDSSVLLRDEAATSDGAPVVGGMAAPQARDVNNSSVRVVVSTGEDTGDDASDDAATETTLLYGVQPRGNTQFPVQLKVMFAPQALERLEWAAELEGGKSLQVFPTAWGRSGSKAAVQAVWESIIAQEPESETDVMHHQLRCHALGAPDKASWNLEPWRPDVPYLDYLLARCNPT